MMYYDHAMLGGTLALAAGVRRRHGWPLVVMAAVAAMLPDWDGLSEPLGPATYRGVHRVWGHNLLAATLAGGVVAALGYLCYLSVCARRVPRPVLVPWATIGADPPRFSAHTLGVWVAVGVLASLSHLPADVLYSAERSGPDWPVVVLWPFTRRGWAVPLLTSSDRGVTLILAAEMVALCVRPACARVLAAGTLLAVAGYLLARWAAG